MLALIVHSEKRGGVRVHPERIEQIIDYMRNEDKTFYCHKTTTLVDHGDDIDIDGNESSRTTVSPNAKICAGWLILAKKTNILNNNFLMRLAQMSGDLNTNAFVAEDKVFDTIQETIEAHKKLI